MLSDGILLSNNLAEVSLPDLMYYFWLLSTITQHHIVQNEKKKKILKAFFLLFHLNEQNLS